LAIKDFSKEDIEELSNIELAKEILKDSGKEMLFKNILKELNVLRPTKLNDDQLVRLYTDLNSDGSFISLGNQEWGIRSWYPVDSIDEATHDGFDFEEEGSKTTASDDVIGFDEDIEDKDIILADEDEEDEIVNKNSSADDEDDDQEDALNTDTDTLDVVDATNDLDDLGDGDVE
jgi:DNA-directed RNA polymerase subunit delta